MKTTNFDKETKFIQSILKFQKEILYFPKKLFWKWNMKISKKIWNLFKKYRSFLN